MPIMDTVNKIKADIEKLPADYQALITGEKTFTQAHPIPAITMAFFAGAGGMYVIMHVFKFFV